MRTKTSVKMAYASWDIQDLEVCARKKPYQGALGTMGEGFGDDWIVPMGLMAALRKQKTEKEEWDQGECPLFAL